MIQSTEIPKMPKKARDIINAYWCYLGAHCDDLSFVHYASMVNRYIMRGASMPKMRSHEISLALTERIRELGGATNINPRKVSPQEPVPLSKRQ